MYFYHSSSSARGVAVFISRFISATINSANNIEIDKQAYFFMNSYEPTKDKPSEQCGIEDKIFDIIQANSDKNFMIGGDFNIVLRSDNG